MQSRAIAHIIILTAMMVILLPKHGYAEMMMCVGIQGETVVYNTETGKARWVASAKMGTSGVDQVRRAFMEENLQGDLAIYLLTQEHSTPETMFVFRTPAFYEKGLNGLELERCDDLRYDYENKAPVYMKWSGDGRHGAYRAVGEGHSTFLENGIYAPFTSPHPRMSAEDVVNLFPLHREALHRIGGASWRLWGESDTMRVYVASHSEKASQRTDILISLIEPEEAGAFLSIQPNHFLNRAVFREVAVFKQTRYASSPPVERSNHFFVYFRGEDRLVEIVLPAQAYQILHADSKHLYLCRSKGVHAMIDSGNRQVGNNRETSFWRVPISLEGGGEPEYLGALPFQPFRLFPIPEQFRKEAEMLLRRKPDVLPEEPDSESVRKARRQDEMREKNRLAETPDLKLIRSNVSASTDAEEAEPPWYAEMIAAHYLATRHFYAENSGRWHRDQPPDFSDFAEGLGMLQKARRASPFAQLDPDGPLPEGLPKAVRAPNGDGTYTVFTMSGDSSGRYTYHDLDTIQRYRRFLEPLPEGVERPFSKEPGEQEVLRRFGTPSVLFHLDSKTNEWNLSGADMADALGQDSGIIHPHVLHHPVYCANEDNMVTLDWDDYVTRILCTWYAARRMEERKGAVLQ